MRPSSKYKSAFSKRLPSPVRIVAFLMMVGSEVNGLYVDGKALSLAMPTWVQNAKPAMNAFRNMLLSPRGRTFGGRR
jgi:hypothetical protein